MPTILLKAPPSGMPARLETHDQAKYGGEGFVFFSQDEQYAIKVYHRSHPEKEQLLQSVMTLFQSLPVEQSHFILPPLALVESVDGQPRVGFVMRRVPSQYRELVDVILNPIMAAQQFQEGKRWGNYLKVARSIAKSVVVLHGKGCAHSDIHFRNFLVSLADGDAIMLEIDGVVVPGFLPPQVAGMMGFMAPEILTQGSRPSERTDRYSLALLLLHTLLFRNVMQPLVEHHDDTNESEKRGWGQDALFSEHPQNRQHRPRNLALPLYARGSLSYHMLTPTLQRLTERAFLEGLLQPEKRPSSWEWEEGLANAMDELWMCPPCQQWFPYPYWQSPMPRRACPFCGERIAAPYPVVLQLYEEKHKHSFFPTGRRVVLGDRFKVFPDVIQPGCKPAPSRRGQAGVGHIEMNSRAGSYHLVNDDDGQWRMRSADSTENTTASKGQSLALRKGVLINFGSGKRLACVMEDGRP